MSDYKKIRKAIKIKCLFSEREAIKAFKNVSENIDIMWKKDKKGVTEEIKALICHIEGNMNQANFYTVMAVTYAVMTGAISVFSNMISTFSDLSNYEKFIFNFKVSSNLFYISMFSALGLLCLGLLIYVMDYKNKFFLKVLNFKLNELNNKNESNEETSSTNETGTKKELNKTNNLDETRGYREYVVRVYDK